MPAREKTVRKEWVGMAKIFWKFLLAYSPHKDNWS